MQPNPLYCALLRALPLLLLVPASAFAETDRNAERNDATLDKIVVTATRSERALKDVPASVDAIDREQMDRHLVRDIRDLVRYEPGVSVTSSAGRFGLGGFRIRGLDGNRVLMQTDGIDVGSAFSIGSFSNANRNFVDLDTLKSVEVVRGPASALYGSDALGGVVAFTSKDPEDFLRAGERTHFGYKLGFDGSWDGLFAGVSGAFAGERWRGLVAISHRQGKATENMGERDVDGALRTVPEPQRRAGRSLLAKLGFAPSPTQRLMLTVEGNEDEIRTDVRSARGYSAMTRWTVDSQHARDKQSRARLSLSHELLGLDTALMDSLFWQLYRQDSQTLQHTSETRHNAAGQQQQRVRIFDFDQRVVGLQLRARKNIERSWGEHRISWGLEAKQSRIQQKRDGMLTDLLTGRTSNVVYPDVFPVRDFPISDVREIGLYFQDEIEAMDGRLSLIPGLRVDHYRLRPKQDAIFAEDNPGIAIVGISDTHVSPKLGGIWRFSPHWSVYGNYAQGFRAPPFNDVNLGFTNVQSGYAALPNPDLRPETSRGLELGLRHTGQAFWFSLAGYQNSYKDFIESQIYIGRSPEGWLLFQSRNVSDAVIRGAELKAGLELGELNPALAGWRLRGAIAHARGTNRTEDAPLSSIDPLRASLGLAYQAEKWGVELAVSGAERKRHLPVSTALPNPWQPPGYAVLDLFFNIEFAPGARLDAGIFNLADRRYADWAGVPGVAANSPTRDRYTMPGRHLGMSLSFNW